MFGVASRESRNFDAWATCTIDKLRRAEECNARRYAYDDISSFATHLFNHGNNAEDRFDYQIRIGPFVEG